MAVFKGWQLLSVELVAGFVKKENMRLWTVPTVARRTLFCLMEEKTNYEYRLSALIHKCSCLFRVGDACEDSVRPWMHICSFDFRSSAIESLDRHSFGKKNPGFEHRIQGVLFSLKVLRACTVSTCYPSFPHIRRDSLSLLVAPTRPASQPPQSFLSRRHSCFAHHSSHDLDCSCGQMVDVIAS